LTIIITEGGKNARKLDTQDFPNEDYLQKYITENPDSIPLYEIKENIKLLIIAREFGTNSGSIDALGLDQDGQLYIIETKLYKNPDKRKVVAQVLDYGASLWKNFGDYEEFFKKIDAIAETNYHVGFDQKLIEFFGIDDEQVNSIHESIHSNLREGNLKFVVLMDRIHQELKDLITFVNQNSKFDIYAVELEYYKHENNEIMIPKLFGAGIRKTAKTFDRAGPRDEEYHTSKCDESIKLLYEELKKKVLEFGDDIQVVPLKLYIKFKRNTNFIDVQFQKSKLLVYMNMNKGTLDDPKNLARDVSEVGKYGNGDYVFSLSNNENLDYVVSLAKKSYEKN